MSPDGHSAPDALRPSPQPLSEPLFVGHGIFRHSSYGDWHPLRIPRVSTVIDLGRALGWLPRERYRTSPRAKPAALRAWHTDAYLAALQRAEVDGATSDAVRERHGIGSPSNPAYPEVWRRPATAAGGSLLAAELLRAGGVVHNPAGGTHHAMPDRAAGFCYLNDAVLAILSMRRAGLRRVAYVDVDAHHCDGVMHAFEAEPDVLMISTHEENRWPRTGALEDEGRGNALNLPLPRGSGDAALHAALHELIGPALEAHRPELIVLQCGADAVEEDPLSGLACTNRAHLEVIGALEGLAPRLLLLGGGGYNPWSVGRLWTAAWGVASGREMPDRLPPEAEAVLRAIRWDARRGRNPPEHWFTTLVDAPREDRLDAEVRARIDRLRRREAVRRSAG